jgi:ABC-type transport system substrate-binding protein
MTMLWNRRNRRTTKFREPRLLHSTSLVPRVGIDYEGFFVSQLNALRDEGGYANSPSSNESWVLFAERGRILSAKPLCLFAKDLPKHEYNPGKAKTILEGAGWVAGSDGIRAKGGQRLEITLSTRAGNHVREQAQQYLQQTWRDVGIKININKIPPAVMWGACWMQSKFEAAFAGMDFVTGPDPDATDYFHSCSINAQGGAGAGCPARARA